MSISTITGLGSGLEINKLVEALANAEKAPKQTQIDLQKARTDTQLSAVGMLKGAVETFESSLLGLKSSSSSFAGFSAVSSKDTVADVSFKPIPATASKVATKPLGAAVTFDGGTLKIGHGSEVPYEVSIAAGSTLAQVRDTINSQLFAKGITANIESDADGTRLVMSSTKTGSGKDLVVTGSGTGAGTLSELGVNGALKKTATDAGHLIRAADAVQAGAGSHVLKVDKLAAASTVASSLQLPGSQYAAGELTIKIGAAGTATKISVPANASLEQIRDSINSQMSGKSISASIISDSSGARLMLSSELTGVGNDIYMTGTDGVTDLTIDPAVAQVGNGAGWLTKASDAEFSIDGLAMTSKDNTVNGLQGLSIKLQEAGTTTLSVSANTNGITASVESFVMAYNTLLTVTNGLTKVTQTTDKDGNATTQAGALVADSTLRSMMSQLRRALSNPMEGAGSLRGLADLGISTNRDGSLALDSDKLKKTVAQDPAALAQKSIVMVDPAAIQEFFTGKSGLINRIGDITSVYSGRDGLLASREASLDATKKSLGVDQVALDRRIEMLTLSLFKKFNAMDSLVARLNATSQSVLATLNALNKKGSDD